jgi:hypothetical protein
VSRCGSGAARFACVRKSRGRRACPQARRGSAALRATAATRRRGLSFGALDPLAASRAWHTCRARGARCIRHHAIGDRIARHCACVGRLGHGVRATFQVARHARVVVAPGARRPPTWQLRRRRACEREQACSFHLPSLSVARRHEPDQRTHGGRRASSRPRERLAWRCRTNALRGMPSWFLRKPGGRVKERKSNRPSESMADAACGRQSPILGRQRHHLQKSPAQWHPGARLDAPGAGNPEGNPGQPTLPPPGVAGADLFREPGRTAASPPPSLRGGEADATIQLHSLTVRPPPHRGEEKDLCRLRQTVETRPRREMWRSSPTKSR